MRKLRVLWVGPFTTMRDGGTGGMLSVATNLLGSRAARRFDYVFLDSTLPSGSTSFIERAWLAAVRVLQFGRKLGSVDAALIFVSDGTSWLEKGMMVLM